MIVEANRCRNDTTKCRKRKLRLLRSMAPGRCENQLFWRGAYLFVDFFGSGNEVLSSTVNWADLLRGTAWGAP